MKDESLSSSNVAVNSLMTKLFPKKNTLVKWLNHTTYDELKFQKCNQPRRIQIFPQEAIMLHFIILNFSITHNWLITKSLKNRENPVQSSTES